MDDLKRRYTDHISKADDHDLLTSLNAKMDSVCKAHKETQGDLKDFVKTIDTRCEGRLNLINSNNKEVVGKSIFKWLIGILVLVLLSVFTVAGMNTVSIARNESTIIQNGIQIGKNARALDKIIERTFSPHDIIIHDGKNK